MSTALRTELADSLRDRFGLEGHIREKAAPEFMPTELGGIEFPRGTLSEISGPASSGRASMLNAVLARTTRRPEFCALIDAGDAYDPLSAERAGIQLARLLWMRCGGSAEKALKATDLVIHGGGFGVVALDLASVPAREARRISQVSWFRLRHAVENTPTALIVIGEQHYTSSCSTFQVKIQTHGFEMREGLFRGLFVEAVLGPRRRANSSFTLKAPYRE